MTVVSALMCPPRWIATRQQSSEPRPGSSITRASPRQLPQCERPQGRRYDRESATARAVARNAEAGLCRGRQPCTAQRGQRVLKGTKPQERRPIEGSRRRRTSEIATRIRRNDRAGRAGSACRGALSG
jgi:hypothetical protein